MSDEITEMMGLAHELGWKKGVSEGRVEGYNKGIGTAVEELRVKVQSYSKETNNNTISLSILDTWLDAISNLIKEA